MAPARAAWTSVTESSDIIKEGQRHISAERSHYTNGSSQECGPGQDVLKAELGRRSYTREK